MKTHFTTISGPQIIKAIYCRTLNYSKVRAKFIRGEWVIINSNSEIVALMVKKSHAQRGK